MYLLYSAFLFSRIRVYLCFLLRQSWDGIVVFFGDSITQGWSEIETRARNLNVTGLQHLINGR